jgi:sugar lactone lactonase YvrE
MTVDTAGNLYVANILGGVNIYSYASGYTLVNTITAGTSYPAAVAINFEGNIFVANNGASNITIYNPALAEIGTITDPTLYSSAAMYINQSDDIWALVGTGVLHVSR